MVFLFFTFDSNNPYTNLINVINSGIDLADFLEPFDEHSKSGPLYSKEAIAIDKSGNEYPPSFSTLMFTGLLLLYVINAT